jgi:glycine cleavage system H lipoate-binding protein/ABC-type phosphate transport system substrate-binding protein
MKTKILLAVGLLIFFIFSLSNRGATQNAPEKETITIWNTPDVRQLTNTLIREYGKLHSNLNFEVLPLGSEEFTKSINETTMLALFSQESDVTLKDNSLVRLVIGRDIIVPVMNAENPFYSVTEQQGISVKHFRKGFTAGKADWGILLGNDAKNPLKIYVLNDRAAQSGVSAFLNLSPEIVAEIESKPANEIIRLVQNDKYAIGFCRLLDIEEPGQIEIIKNLKLLPIDKNGNGQIDYHEKIYGSLNDFKRGVWIGKYPRTLIRNIYSVSSAVQENEKVTDFLSWVVTDGQQFMESGGFSELTYNERQSRLETIHPQLIAVENAQPHSAKSRTFLFIVLGILVIVIIAGIVYRSMNKKSKIPLGTFPIRTKVLTENTMSFPGGLYFDKSHTWVFMEKEGMVKFGIDDFIPNVTGDYTRIILKKPGEKVKRREAIVTLVQKGKQIYIHAPVSGTIKEINEVLVADPFAINYSPYGEGWVYMIEPSNWLREIRFFKMGEAYKEWISSEIARLKDFLACSFNIKNLEGGNLAVQEGGELITEPLKDLGPELWEDFQAHFIETSDMY